MNNDPRNHNEKERVVETASATTSSDNSNSGPFAYIITAVVLCVTVLGSLAMGGCVSALATTAINRSSTYAPGTSNTYSPLPYGDLEDYSYDNFDEWLQQYENQYDTDAQTQHQYDTDSASVADVLDFGIAAYGDTINDTVSASSYAGVSNELREFVRSITASDEDYTSQLCTLLNEAALDESVSAERITSAIALCDEANKHFAELEIGDFKGGDTAKVKDYLESAKSAAAERWKALHDEIALLNTTGSVDTTHLWRFDDDVYDATEEAASYLEDAMSASSTKSTN